MCNFVQSPLLWAFFLLPLPQQKGITGSYLKISTFLTAVRQKALSQGLCLCMSPHSLQGHVLALAAHHIVQGPSVV